MRFFQALASGVTLAAATAAGAATRPDEGPIQEVIVSATLLRDQAIQVVPASLTVMDQSELSRPGQQHFEDVLAQVPEPQLGRRHVAAAVFPNPRHWRA